MELTAFESVIEKQFDYICKRVIMDERKDYFRNLYRISENEISFSEINDNFINQVPTTDIYSVDFTSFNFENNIIWISNDSLANSINQLSEKKQKIILLYYFCDLNDLQISKIVNLSRSTVNEHRLNCLTLIKKNMMEDMRNGTKIH